MSRVGRPKQEIGELSILPGIFCYRETLTQGERHSGVTRDEGTVTLYPVRATTVLSRNCCTDFGRPLTKKVMSHSPGGRGVMAPLHEDKCCTSRSGVASPPFRYPPLTNLRLKEIDRNWQQPAGVKEGFEQMPLN